MTQAIPEAKNVTQPQPEETLETNGFDTPTEGHEEQISNNQAELKAAEDVEEQTGAVDAGEQEILEDPQIKVEPSGPNVPHEIEQEVAAVGVEVVNPHEEVKELDAAAQILGGGVVGHEAPTAGLGQTQGEFNIQPAPEPEPIISETEAFDAGKSGKFAKGDGNILRKAVLGRMRELLHAKVPKIFGGQKVAPELQQNNITQIPQPQETKQAA